MIHFTIRFFWSVVLIGFSNYAIAQFTVTGAVTDDVTGDPLLGVTILVKGTALGVITDIDGKYSITIEGTSATLAVSSVGYLGQEFPVNSSTSSLDIKLSEDIFNLEEIVITGLGTSVKRSNLANAVSTVSGKELTGATSVQTVDAALQGKMVGANIVQNSGAPGGGMSVRLRGSTTITGSSEPLYIVDGIYMDNSSFSAGTNPVSLARTNGEVTDEQELSI